MKGFDSEAKILEGIRPTRAITSLEDHRIKLMENKNTNPNKLSLYMFMV